MSPETAADLRKLADTKISDMDFTRFMDLLEDQITKVTLPSLLPLIIPLLTPLITPPITPLFLPIPFPFSSPNSHSFSRGVHFLEKSLPPLLKDNFFPQKC